jgi:hypothetical protein
MWWGFIFITGGAALFWGIITLQWSWAGIFTIIFGATIISSLIVAVANRRKLKRVVLHEFQTIPDASIEEISMKTGISRRDVQAIVLDLKSSGQLIVRFSTKTGHIKDTSFQNTSSEIETKYCHSCGTPISKESDQYCAYCGAKI